MDRILEKQFLANIKGSYMYDVNTKFFGLGSKEFLFPVVLRLRGKNVPPPKWPNKIFFVKS